MLDDERGNLPASLGGLWRFRNGSRTRDNSIAATTRMSMQSSQHPSPARRSRPTWAFSFALSPGPFPVSQRRRVSCCGQGAPSRVLIMSEDGSSVTATTPPRRAFLQVAAASAICLVMRVSSSSTAADELNETFNSKKLHIAVTYPKAWFRSDRDGSLVLISVKDAVAATVSRRRIQLASRPDPFSAAYDCIRDRIEREGADIVIKNAEFRDGTLLFKFRMETMLPNGDSIVRLGTGRAIPDPSHSDVPVCIVTAPKESWESIEPVSEHILSSLRLIS